MHQPKVDCALMLRKMILKTTFERKMAVALSLSTLVAIVYASIVNLSFLLDDFGIVRLAALPQGGTSWRQVFNEYPSSLIRRRRNR
jgi:hypothetical protein